MRALWILIASALILLLSKRAAAQSTNEMNAANNPLQPSLGINLQDQYVGRYYGLGNDVDSNAFPLRGVQPHKTFDAQRIPRATMPVGAPPTGRHTDASDLNVFDLFWFKTSSIEWEIGPQLTIPTAGREDAGPANGRADLPPWRSRRAAVVWPAVSSLTTILRRRRRRARSE